MKRLQKFFYIALLSCFASCAFADDHADAWKNAQGWWNATDIPAFDNSKIAKQLPLVKVKGNKFVDDKGEVKCRPGDLRCARGPINKQPCDGAHADRRAADHQHVRFGA